jgi:HSP20 family molecular chaperone IbpA
MDHSKEHMRQINLQHREVDIKLLLYHGEVHALFEEIIHKPWGHSTWRPLVDIFEEEESFRIKVDLPGVSPEEINVSVSGTRLFIEGRRLSKDEPEDSKMLVSECPQGIFFREIEFFRSLSAMNINKQYNNGVLTIIIKKYEGK